MFLQRLGATDTATVAVEAHETDQPHSGGTTSVVDGAPLASLQVDKKI